MRHGKQATNYGSQKRPLPTPLKQRNIIAKRNRYYIASGAGTRVMSNGEIVEYDSGLIIGYQFSKLPPLVEDRDTKLRHYDGMSTHRLGTVPKVIISQAEEALLRQIRLWNVVISEKYRNYQRSLRDRSRLFTDQQLIDLYEQGLYDGEIGEKLGAANTTVNIHRRRLGLKAHSRRLFTDEQLIEFYDQGFNDREISERLGIARTNVSIYRRSLGLKAQSTKRRFTDEQLIELYDQGLNDVEIGEKLGVHTTLIYIYRKRLGLKAHDRRLLFTDQQLITLYEKGMIDREIAEEMGVHKATVGYRRRKLGLEAQKFRHQFTDQQPVELHAQGLIMQV